MEDQIVERLSDSCDVVSNQDSDHSVNLEIDETTSNETQDASSLQGQTLPILKKVIDLSTKIQDLKKEHAAISDQFKHSTSSFPDPEALNAIQTLSTEHDLLKNKYMEESLKHELLKKKYMREAYERKQYYNEVIELKGNIRVFCRCRPINEKETSNGNHPVVEYDSSVDNELQVICSDSSKKQFKFDHVFRPDDNQEAVFAQTKPIVTSVLDGYNVCIFAYGQTGTGKTFTMEGTPENRGVNYRTVEELFRISEERGVAMRYELLVSMLEVYNETIRDLLVDSNNNQQAKKLEIKQAADGTQEVPGLIEAHVFGVEDVWELLKAGSKVRSVGSTSVNEMSSRSHCLLRVTVKGENIINGQKTKSHLWLVDLAGSERLGRIEVEGERLKESQNINKSLSALGDVIAALASKTSHVPYRNSKLTHMLQSSLGGDCKTLMFVQISPSSSDIGETICSLNFASRVRGIESGPARRQADLSELAKYKQLAEKSKHDEKETKKLQDSLQSMQTRLAARELFCRNLQDKVRDLEKLLADERKTRLKQESRALAAVSVPSGSNNTASEKKPPLAPTSKLRMPIRNMLPIPPQRNEHSSSSSQRMPLRRISNIMLPAPQRVLRKDSSSSQHYQQLQSGKENLHKSAANNKPLYRARRSSIATFSSTSFSSTTTPQVSGGFKPRKRVSIATFRPERSSPVQVSISRFNHNNNRQSRYSRLWTPMPELSGELETPVAARSSSKFMGSPPPSQGGGSRLQAPAANAIVLQRKPVVWSPLNLRSLNQQFNKKRPNSMLPLRMPRRSLASSSTSDFH